MSFKRRNIFIRIWYHIYNQFCSSTPEEFKDGSAEEFLEEYNNGKEIHNNRKETKQ